MQIEDNSDHSENGTMLNSCAEQASCECVLCGIPIAREEQNDAKLDACH